MDPRLLDYYNAELLHVSGGFDWAAARDLAADGTRLFPGDLLAGPALGGVDVYAGTGEVEASGIGVREHTVVA